MATTPQPDPTQAESMPQPTAPVSSQQPGSGGAPSPAAQPSPGSTEDLEARGLAAHQQPAPVSLAPKPPTTKRTGLAGVVDSMLDDMAGTKGAAKLHQGDDGNYYVETPALSRKGQWLKIASEALHGAAAGAAQMHGPGGAGRGFAAGVEAGDKMGADQRQQGQQVTQEARQAKQDQFNQIKLQHDKAMWAFEEAHAQHQGTQDEIKFNNEEMAREAKPVEQGGLGSQDLGVHRNLADLATQMSKTNPTFWKQVYGDTQGSGVVGYTEYDPSGKVTGIHFFARTPGVNGQFLPEDQATFKVFKPGKTAQDTPTFEQQKATVPLMVGQQTSYNAAADNQMSQWQETQRKATKEAADLAHVNAETRASNASARHSDAETAASNAAAAGAGDNSALVEAIRSGKVAPESLSRMLGGKQGQQLLTQVEAGGGVDTSKLESYPKMYQDFTSGKTANQRQNLDNSFKAVKDLTALNTYASRLPLGAPRREWDNRLTNAAQEIANGLAKPGTAAMQESIRHIWVSLASPVSRQAAVDKQMDSLMDAYESMRTRWKEGAPSAVYEAKMPDVGAASKEAMYLHDKQRAGAWFGVPYYDKAGGKLLGFSRDGGKTLEPAQ